VSERVVGWEQYDGFTRGGTSKYVRALRLGRGRWRAEFAASGFAVLLGPVTFSAGFEWSDA
jgi:hypothetical protein